MEFYARRKRDVLPAFSLRRLWRNLRGKRCLCINGSRLPFRQKTLRVFRRNVRRRQPALFIETP